MTLFAVVHRLGEPFPTEVELRASCDRSTVGYRRRRTPVLPRRSCRYVACIFKHCAIVRWCQAVTDLQQGGHQPGKSGKHGKVMENVFLPAVCYRE